MTAAATVAICCHDRPAYLRACLAGLAAQSPAVPVLVVDSASPPPAAAAIAELTRLAGARLIRLDDPGVSIARNVALATVETEWIAYLDDDAQAEADWSEVLHATIGAHTGAAGLGGRILPQWEAPCPDWWPPELVPALTILDWDRPGRVGDGSLPPHVEPYGANMAFRAAALRAVGGFPAALGRVGTRLLSGEEAWVVRALTHAGGAVLYEPALVVRHSIQAGRLTPRWLLSRQHWSGVSEAVMARAFGERSELCRKAARMAALLATKGVLLALPQSARQRVRRRCALHFAAGYLRGATIAV